MFSAELTAADQRQKEISGRALFGPSAEPEEKGLAREREVTLPEAEEKGLAVPNTTTAATALRPPFAFK